MQADSSIAQEFTSQELLVNTINQTEDKGDVFPVYAYVGIPSGVLSWVDANVIAKEFVVMKEGGTKVQGSMNVQGELKGFRWALVSKSPESYLIIVFQSDEEIIATFTSTQTISDSVTSTKQAGEWRNT
ncbi:hypothetical protein RSOL_344690 [Rhizoctonia solani AG-3 Rhs1AP]|uniref:Uncharacterized protein n=1 Tax=Rhizoctonia solani AG-3 Rhs1AP TaxID=1086054 RepID=X8JB00_9AGAM|nr:hypothetical protein RSOL_344690 [Rhizoctonia solani AG-3 Rhs1AP]